ncbi:hypothetical protein AOLI_G00183050 [Acnodon oligacanthus]
MLPCTELPLLKHLEHWSMCMCGGEIERQKENRRSMGFDSLDNGRRLAGSLICGCLRGVSNSQPQLISPSLTPNDNEWAEGMCGVDSCMPSESSQLPTLSRLTRE